MRTRVPTAAVSTSRSGTQAAPHVRVDGQATRSTTLHLEVDLHQELRMEAARCGVHMSEIVNDALREWASRRPMPAVPAVPTVGAKVSFSSYVAPMDQERFTQLVESSGKSRVRLLAEALNLLFGHYER